MRSSIWKSFLILLLCLVVAVAIFASCDSSGGGDDETTAGSVSNTETVTVSNVVILTSASADSDTSAAAQILVDAIKQYTGVDAVVKTDAELENAQLTEILIGATNRTQSEGVLADLGGQSGYVVKRVDGKIVINATSVTMLDDAVNYFVNNYVSSGSDGSFEIAKDLAYTYGSTGGVTLLGADNKSQYKIVFSQNVEATGGKKENDDGTVTYDPDAGIDYIVPFIRNVVSELGTGTGVTVSTDNDVKPAQDENLEILIGNTNRPETKTFLKGLAPNEYGYGVVGNKLVIAGWGDYTSAMAIEKFIEGYGQYLVDVDGTVKNLVMADGEKQVFAYDKWNVDIPMFQGGELMGVVDGLTLYSSYYMCYENATVEGYREYLTQLEAAGYSFHQDNQIGDNLYATYYNSKANIHAYYVASENTVRVAVDDARLALLPPNEDNSQYKGEKVTDVTFTLYAFDHTKQSSGTHNWGNAFIITLEDGSFIFHDGGANSGSFEDDELWELLNHLNKRKDGKIVIAAYILSHGHADHHNAFDGLLNNHGDEIILEKMIHGEPGKTQIYKFYKNGHYATGSMMSQAMKMGAEVYRAHTGQTFQIRNLTINAMFVVETTYPYSPDCYNSTSFITRFTVGEGDDAQTMMITGDTQDMGSQRLVQVYGEYLKCDILQGAHHGGGGSVDLYALCKPTVVVWPNTQKSVDNNLAPSNTGKYALINKSLLNQENVVLIIAEKDGHKTFSIPLLGLTEDEEANERLIEITPRFDGRTIYD